MGAAAIAGGIIGGSVLSGVLGSKGATKAADKQFEASELAVEENKRQFDLIFGTTQAGRQVGNQALNALSSAFIPGFQGLQGLNQFGLPFEQQQQQQFNFGGRGGGRGFRQQEQEPGLAPLGANDLQEIFRNLPGSQFGLDQIEKNVGNSFASRGGAFGGNALTALTDRQSNFAADRTFNNLFQLAGFGPQANQLAGNASAATTVANTQAILSGGNAQAAGIQGQFGSLNNAFQGGLNNLLLAERLGLFEKKA